MLKYAQDFEDLLKKNIEYLINNFVSFSYLKTILIYCIKSIYIIKI